MNEARRLELLATLPQERGSRRLVDVEVLDGHGYIAVIECTCGFVTRRAATEWKTGRCGLGCSSCSGRRRAARAVRERFSDYEQEPFAMTAEYTAALHSAWQHLPPEKDPHYQEFIRVFSDGSTLQDIASFYGLSRERIRQIEEVALRKLRDADDGALRAQLAAVTPSARHRARVGQTLGWDEVPTFETMGDL